MRRHAAAAEQLDDPLAGFVATDDAQQPGLAAERHGIARDVGRTAEPLLLTLHVHDRHRRLRRNAVDVAEPVTVEHHVADDEHTRAR